MKITQSKVRKIVISGVDNLDPVRVFVEDFEPGHGQITIACYDKYWGAYFNGQGGSRKIVQFIIDSPVDYLVGKLASQTPQTITDFQKVKEETKLDVCEDSVVYFLSELNEFYGQGWDFYAPSKTNPEFEYFCRIIKAVKAGLELSAQPTGQSNAKGAE